MELRVMRQSKNADALVGWLDGCLKGQTKGEDADLVRKHVAKLVHASIQKEEPWLKQQMPNGFGPVFAIWLADSTAARTFPSKLKLFHHATSLGGVESLIEWRRMSDNTVEDTMLRVSVGIEDWKDLRMDIVEGLRAMKSK
jgi:cystathionine beta-lyase/cystathionine gamma-synthase